jgi:hypothetical protein
VCVCACAYVFKTWPCLLVVEVPAPPNPPPPHDHHTHLYLAQAVNGDASGTDENVCTHTQFDHEPWWEVDLGTVRGWARVIAHVVARGGTDL